MSPATVVPDAPRLVVRLRPFLDLDDEQLYRLCRANSDLRFERTSEGELLIMAPTGGETGRRSLAIAGALWQWARADGTGVGFDSSTGFVLPNRAVRSPDAAWILRDRWEAVAPGARERFVPLCPDFVIELLSPSDRLEDAEAKMREYIDNGLRLGWLLDPQARRVSVYRPGGEVEPLDDPLQVAGDPVLPGFALDLREVW